MMYNQKLVASIKSKGKILREFKDTVYIPFASEYSILLKNLNTVRAVVNVFIDGENAVPGGLVIDPGRSVDLERWIKNGNLSEGNKFKFIERTRAIEDGPRGIKLEDGLIRVEYQFELPRPVFQVNQLPDWQKQQLWNDVKYYGNVTASGSTTSFNVGGVLRGADFSKGESVKAQATSAVNTYCAINNIQASGAIHDGMATMDCSFNDVGITVPGSKSTQSFQSTTVGALESTVHNIVLKIVGDLGYNKPVEKAVTVKAKPKCVTCGKQNKATSKFCAECGTALEIFA
jgi:zinc-ribbon domain